MIEAIRVVMEYSMISDVNEKLRDPHWVYIGLRSGFHVIGRLDKPYHDASTWLPNEKALHEKGFNV